MALLVGLAMVGAIAMWATDTASQVEAVMNVMRPWLYAAQLSCTALLWLNWQAVVQWLARHKRISPRAVEPLLQARHRVVVLILLIQLTVGMGLPFSLLGAPGGQ